VVNEFTKNHANDNVRVFSINVWERGKSPARRFMDKNNYAMTLLYGNDELAKAYGVEGIPHLCVIDKNGNIRYVEKGFTDGLDEKLVWWTEDCLKD
ncbi:MAG: TlpA disulfide reductase family protein, partial [Candidatus Zixiibacteriota bacterium]